VIGTRFIDEHHEIHDYPGDKHDDDDDDHESSEDSDYHHAIYDHVQIDKDDYSDFGDSGELIAAATYRIALSLSTAFEHVALRGVAYRERKCADTTGSPGSLGRPFLMLKY